MRSPTLDDLPAPPLGRTGWPWTEESPRLPTGERGKGWPRISIVTPSYNQDSFLEEAIRSVLLQGYPDLEYILMDGGSRDDSLNVVRKYEQWLTYWVSERDHGQADALRKGFDKARGQLLGWINADDLLAPCALQVVADAYVRHPQFGLYAGTVENFTHVPFEENREVVKQHNISFMDLLLPTFDRKPRFHQPGIFFTSDLYRGSGGIDPSYYYRMDYDLIVRMLDNNARVCYLDETIAYFRKHAASKTGRRSYTYFVRVFQETNRVKSRYARRFSGEDQERLRLQYLDGLLHGAYYALASAQLIDAAGYLRLAIGVGRLTLCRAIPRAIVQAAPPRLARLFET
jgi:glycosyltransferase involved in cell wall biosynthesis